MLRIVVAEPGTDGGDRGAQVVARALRDGGHEVIYAAAQQTPEQIVETAIQEDADLIGLSVSSRAHLSLLGRLTEVLLQRDAGDIVVFGSGTAPDHALPLLAEMGVAKVFAADVSTGEITGWVAEEFPEG